MSNSLYGEFVGPKGAGTLETPVLRARIVELEGEVADLRQRLIGGVEGVRAGRDLTKWADANDRRLRKSTS